MRWDRQTSWHSLADECRQRGSECLTFRGDVRDDKAVTQAVEATVARFGRIDILFNNAGICAYGLAHELTEEAWDAMLDINLKGAWLVARRVIPVMIGQRSGVIINNSSIAGLRGMGRLSHYAASKWGLTGLTKSWAIELAPYGIRVNSLHPTGVNTPMNDGLAAMEGLTPAEIAERICRQPAAGALDRARRCGPGCALPCLRPGALRHRSTVRHRCRAAQPVRTLCFTSDSNSISRCRSTR